MHLALCDAPAAPPALVLPREAPGPHQPALPYPGPTSPAPTPQSHPARWSSSSALATQRPSPIVHSPRHVPSAIQHPSLVVHTPRTAPPATHRFPTPSLPCTSPPYSSFHPIRHQMPTTQLCLNSFRYIPPVSTHPSPPVSSLLPAPSFLTSQRHHSRHSLSTTRSFTHLDQHQRPSHHRHAISNTSDPPIHAPTSSSASALHNSHLCPLLKPTVSLHPVPDFQSSTNPYLT